MRAHVSLASALLAAVVVSGCAVGPDYHRPELSVRPAFMGAQAVETRKASGQADLLRWWEGFNDPVLTQLESLAIAQNLDLEQAVARVTQSRASLRAATAALLPSGSVSGEAAQVHMSEQTALGRVLAATPNFDRNSPITRST